MTKLRRSVFYSYIRLLIYVIQSSESFLFTRIKHFVLQITDLYLPTAEVAAIQYRQKQEFLQQDTTTNVFLAAFTTTYARLKLYDEIDRLGTSVLYMDTDSIIYETNGTNDPLLGDYLGQFTDELGGATIRTFVSGKEENL